jgi:syntaxin 5
VRAIETSIHEISQTFRQLANLVTEQGERIQRIDQNLDFVNINLEAGQAQLTRYLRGMSSNRTLMLKLFAIIILFIFIYAWFL